MTQRTTQALIDRLAAGGAPVRRLPSPLTRAFYWIGGYLLLAAAAIWLAGAWRADIAEIELAGAFLTGSAAVIAAFILSLPDRGRLWMLLPLPPLILWLAGSSYGCYLNLVEFGPSGWIIGQSWDCFAFILLVSVPASAALFVALRRAAPLDPVPVLAAGGLGVAGLASAALQFFHPFDITFLDLGMHLAAAIIVISTMTILGRNRLAPPLRPV